MEWDIRFNCQLGQDIFLKESLGKIFFLNCLFFFFLQKNPSHPPGYQMISLSVTIIYAYNYNLLYIVLMATFDEMFVWLVLFMI